MQEIIKEIIKNLVISNDDEIMFDEFSKKSLKIEKNNFHDIILLDSEKTIGFIDGGNLEIIKSPSLSLFFNRVYYCIYKKNKRVQNKKIEFYSLITSNKEGIKTKCFPDIIKEYFFDSFDKNLTVSNKRLSVDKVGSIIRRLAELSIAKDIRSDYVLIDGSLEFDHEYEKEIISKFNNVAGLSKTTSMITKNGLSVSGFLNKITNKPLWYYDCGNDLYFVKLHKNSKYVFKLEHIGKNFKELLSLISKNSKDPVFLGYPYGLVEADRLGRVSKKESDLLKIQIRTKLKDSFKLLEPHLNSSNSHDILDNIS